MTCGCVAAALPAILPATVRRHHAARDEVAEGVDRGEDGAIHLVRRDLESVVALERKHQLECVDRVEPETLPEQRHVIADAVGREPLEIEALDDQTLELLSN